MTDHTNTNEQMAALTKKQLRVKLINLAVDHKIHIKELQSEYFDNLVELITTTQAEAVREARIEQTEFLHKAEKQFEKVDWTAALRELNPRKKINAQLTKGNDNG